MKYKNANDILPDELLIELQKYVTGEVIYIPKPQSKKCSWGEKTGTRAAIAVRNDEIRRKFEDGFEITALAEEYFLARETVKKIVYSKKTA